MLCSTMLHRSISLYQDYERCLGASDHVVVYFAFQSCIMCDCPVVPSKESWTREYHLCDMRSAANTLMSYIQ